MENTKISRYPSEIPVSAWWPIRLFSFLDEEENITKRRNSKMEKTSAKMRKFRWKKECTEGD
jgi:hypothetical protein